MNINYLRKDLDVILENFVSVMKLWINGTLYLHDVLIEAIKRLSEIYQPNWN